MSRKSQAELREIEPDRKYESVLLAKFINALMLRGKRSIAQNIVYDAFDAISGKITDAEPLEVFTQAIENIKPALEVKSRRVGGANYQVPIEVRPSRRQALAFRWLLDAARGRGEKRMEDRLANELMDAYNRTGAAVRKREDVHRMADANKAFAHYRW